MAARTVDVHEHHVNMAVIMRVNEDTGVVETHVKGYMNPDELVAQLREIADHIATNGPVNG